VPESSSQNARSLVIIPVVKSAIYPITAASPNRITIVARPRGNDWLCDELRALSHEGIDVLVSMLTDEEANDLGLRSEPAECRAAGIRFVNVAIPDRSVPPDQSDLLSTVQQLAELVRSGRYRVHCRASIGPSSMHAASRLVRLGCDASKLFYAIESAGGCSVPATPEQKQWVASNVHKG